MVGIGALKRLSAVEKPRQIKKYTIYQGTAKVGTIKARSKAEAKKKMFKRMGINVNKRKRAFKKYMKSYKKRSK